MLVLLDPLKVVREIKSSTPLCVLSYIAKILNIRFKKRNMNDEEYFSKFLEFVTSSRKYTVNYPLGNNEECENFSYFLCSEDPWTEESMNEALESYLPYFSDEKITNIECIFGEKTNSVPKSLTIIQLYRICIDFEYPMSVNTTFEEMAYAVDKSINDTKESLSLLISDLSKKATFSSLINVSFNLLSLESRQDYQKSPKEIKKTERSSFDTIFSSCMNNVNYLISRISPKSDDEAIYISHKRWNIFIGESTHPIMEFKKLVQCEKKGNEYFPVSGGLFVTSFSKNKNWYDTRSNWFGEFIEMYDYSELYNFCLEEGFIESKSPTKDFLKSFLMDRRNISNFYPCVVPYSSWNITFIGREPISESVKLISIGNINRGEIVYFSPEELISFFENEKMCIDPISREMLDSFAINKLKKYCSSEIKETGSFTHKKLLKCIESIEHCMKLFNVGIIEMKKEIFHNEEFATELKFILNKLLRLGLIMRGNLVTNTKSLSSHDCTYDKDKYALIFQQSLEEYNEFSQMLGNLKFERIIQFIRSSNIITFSEYGHKAEFFGKTIKVSSFSPSIKIIDCMQNSFYGSNENESSCLRENSNWIVYTASWYIHIFSFGLNFDINEIEEIS